MTIDHREPGPTPQPDVVENPQGASAQPDVVHGEQDKVESEKGEWWRNPRVKWLLGTLGATVLAVSLGVWKFGAGSGDKPAVVDTSPNQLPGTAAPQTPGRETPPSASPEAKTKLGFPVYEDPELEAWGFDPGVNRGKDGHWLYTPDTFPYSVRGVEMNREAIIEKYTLDTTRYPTQKEAARALVEVVFQDFVYAGNGRADVERAQRYITDGSENFAVMSTDGIRGGDTISGQAWATQSAILTASMTGMGKDGKFEDIPAGIRDESSIPMSSKKSLTGKITSVEHGLNRISRVVGWSNNAKAFENGNPENMGNYKPELAFKDMVQTDPDGDPWAVQIIFDLTDNLASTDSNGNLDAIPPNVGLEHFQNTKQVWVIGARLTKTSDGSAWKIDDKKPVEWSVKEMSSTSK